MRTAVAVVAMISGKLWFFIEALVLICLIKLIKGVFN
tara:strand:- start:7776 stop:7886 length:111 start_codon:yes stop_codon:yes gene_type:complete